MNVLVAKQFSRQQQQGVTKSTLLRKRTRCSCVRTHLEHLLEGSDLRVGVLEGLGEAEVLGVVDRAHVLDDPRREVGGDVLDLRVLSAGVRVRERLHTLASSYQVEPSFNTSSCSTAMHQTKQKSCTLCVGSRGESVPFGM